MNNINIPDAYIEFIILFLVLSCFLYGLSIVLNDTVLGSIIGKRFEKFFYRDSN